MALMEISVVPLGTGTPSVSGLVAAAVREAENSGLDTELTPMGTVITGDVDELLAVAGKMHRAVLSGDVKRVVTTIKIDDRTDKTLTAKGKLSSVREKLGRQ